MTSTERFAGKHVVVTGASRGMGRAIAVRLGAEGARLTLMARDRERCEETARAVGAATVQTVDIRDRAAVNAAFEAAAEAHGSLFGLVAVSGVGGPNEAGEGDRFEELVATNLVGTYWCVRAAERHLVDAGRVVVIASILARIAVPGYTGYSASKAGLLGLVRSLAAELAPRRVQVNAVLPGWVDTDMAWRGLDAMSGTREEAYADAMREVPLGRMAQPEEVAGTVAWLLSGDSVGVTGQAIDHNGGAWVG
jgi:NAD(P)-dependent dehydrogenase (short-subunit alcohol dehydrogenase family)